MNGHYFFIILYRLSNDSDILKTLLLGMTGLTAFLSTAEKMVVIIVPLVTCGSVVYLAWKKGQLINRELRKHERDIKNDLL